MSGNRGSHNSSSANSYTGWSSGQRSTSQQYLTPEDMYNLSSGGSQYAAFNRSYPASRHSGETHSPSYSSSGSANYQYPTHSHVSSSNAQRHSYNDPSRHTSSSAPSQSYNTSTTSAYDNSSRHDTYSPNYTYSSTSNKSTGKSDRHLESSTTDKGKAKDAGRKSSSDDSTSRGRHTKDSSSGRKAGPALPPGEKLVSGVFIRY
ncbi:uncharacterized protein AB675_6361 [Cyphellophora attinorum]|uniref:Uncharacterized protein n=1 Tax=Cyphellophora attinorum TaxID=1664694 RepID=A0A0N0NQP8_9EURO|nr:uncharacterized protein AB675_6361 [Phialophora attinorum]KPI43949.1 hypothetical protein AB675_6361 [Phialophora attinorum]